MLAEGTVESAAVVEVDARQALRGVRHFLRGRGELARAHAAA